MMQVNERGQRGATLLVVMVILVAMTWFVLSGYRSAASTCRSSATARTGSRHLPPLTGDRRNDQLQSFTKDPTAVAAAPILTDIDGNGVADLTAVLSPAPACYRARVVRRPSSIFNCRGSQMPAIDPGWRRRCGGGGESSADIRRQFPVRENRMGRSGEGR